MYIHMTAHDGYDFRTATCGASEEIEPVLDLKGFVDCLDDLDDEDTPCPHCLLVAREALLILR